MALNISQLATGKCAASLVLEKEIVIDLIDLLTCVNPIGEKA
jgi:hypothetical protein